MNLILEKIPSRNRNKTSLFNRIKEASGIAYYRTQEEYPIIELLITDDAPQYSHITEKHELCWIHIGRAIKKLNPFLLANRQILEEFLKKFWEFYHELRNYGLYPDPKKIEVLVSRFEQLFQTKTGYSDLDEQINKILCDKERLLLILDYPEIPLHNNEAELGARVQVRKRDVSLHTKTEEGTKAQDTFLSIKETARKLGVNFFEYLTDRFYKKNLIERLAITILKKSKLKKESKQSEIFTQTSQELSYA